MSNMKNLADILKVCSVLPIFAVMPAIGATHTEDLVVKSTDKKFEIGTGGTEIYTGSLSGDGIVYVRPGSTVTDGFRPDTTAVFEGSIADFTGEFRTTQWSNGEYPNARGNIVFKNWADGQTVKLQGSDGNNKGNSATIVFDGKNKVKLLAQRDSGATASIYLTGGATLDKTSDVDHSVYFGANGVDEDSVKLELSGYKTMDGAVMHAGGSNNKVAGDVVTKVSKSVFKEIYGNGYNTDVEGSIKLKVEDVTAKTVAGTVASDKSWVKGNVVLGVSDSDISGTVLGTTIWGMSKSTQKPQSPLGVEGAIIVNVDDSVVAQSIRGANSSAGYDAATMAEVYTINDIVINVEDTAVGEEIIGMGSNLSAKGDITINMEGANAVGYADLEATTELDGDITVRVGAKRAGTQVAGNTTLNIDTDGANEVWVNGILNPGNESSAGYVLGDATLNMTNTGDGRGEIFAKTIETFNVKGDAVINMSNVDVTISENIADAFDEINIGEGAVLTVKDLAMKDGSALNMTMTDTEHYGKLAVTGDATVSGADLNLLVGSVGKYQDVLAGVEFDDFASVSAGLAFVVDKSGDDITVTTKSVEDLAADTGLSTNAAAVVVGLANADSHAMQQVSLAAQTALNAGDKATVEAETAKVAPDNKPVAQSVAMSVQNQVVNMAANRMATVTPMGRNGGDTPMAAGAWVQGMFNKSKLNDQFHGYSRGFALGGDTVIADVFTIGGGYAYGTTDVHADNRDTDIESSTVFMYAQYKPTNWYLNATLSYTMSEYEEQTTVFGMPMVNTYDVDSYGAQMMTGYTFASGITPEMGVRYLYVESDDYNNGLGDITVDDTQYLAGVMGLKYAFEIESDWALKLRPELRAAATYDFLSDEAIATVTMPGAPAYVVNGDRLSRMGGEFGIGLTAEYKGLNVSLTYDLDLHKDYTSQTGMLKFRYNF